jgi:hypothetical protein
VRGEEENFHVQIFLFFFFSILHFASIVAEENLPAPKTKKLIEDYLFADRESLRDGILEFIEGDKPSILQQRKNYETGF